MNASVRQIYDTFKPVPSDPLETSNRFMQWCQYFFGDKNVPEQYWIRLPFSRAHREFMELICNNYRYTLVSTPRGLAKTTIVAILYTVYKIVYNQERFIVIIGKNDDAGKENLGNIRDCLAINQKIQAVYGKLLPEGRVARADKGKSEDSQHQITLTNGIRLRSIGMRGSIRGKVKVFRPTLVIVEDPQDVKTMRETTTLEAHQEFFDHDVMYALDPLYGKVVLIGNNLGIGCTVNNMMKDDRFIRLVYDDIIDADGNSIWPEMYPIEKLREEEKRMRAMGKGHVYDQERRNIPNDSFRKSITGYKLHRDSIRYNEQDGYNYLVSDLYPHPIRVRVAYTIDPAFSDAKSSDMRAKVVMAVGQYPTEYGYRKGVWIIRYSYDHSDPSNVPDNIIDMHRQYLFDDVIIEANGGQLIYKYLIDNRLGSDMFYMKHPFSMHYERYVSQSKGDRIWNSISLLCKNAQFFLCAEHTELISELDNFGYDIRNSGIHILDAITMGLKYVNAPEPNKLADLGRVLPTRIKEKATKLDWRKW